MFPYSGKTSFPASSDAGVTALQAAHSALEDVLLGVLEVDPNLKILAHLDSTLTPEVGNPGSGAGAVRFWTGRYGKAPLIEGPGTNLLSNPSAEIDLTAWSPVDASVNLSRDTTVGYTGNGTASIASFKIAGTGNAGSSCMTSSATVAPNTQYSASVYVYASATATNPKAKLGLSFSGGTPVSYNTGAQSLTAGGWTRLRLENVNSSNNNTVAVNVYLNQGSPSFPSPSRLSTIGASATAPVTDNAMSISTGDLVMCAVTANPSGPLNYAWHIVTGGATGVSSSGLRLDGASAAPTFVSGTQFSRLGPAPGDSVAVTDNALVLNAGDFVFCNLANVGYAWHLVTTGATGAANAALRLDDAPSAPNYVVGSRLTRLVPTASAAVTDNAMTINAGDMVLCRTIANPSSSSTAYAWHMVTTGATGVSSSSLRLDGASAAPTFATGSTFSKQSASASGVDTDNSAVLNTGDFALAYPTKNPAASGYGWHMITTGATGVANSSLKIDQTSSGTIWADCVQLEAGAVATSFIDSYQGSGYSGAVGTTTSRASSRLSFPTSGTTVSDKLSVAFWMYPLWNGADNAEHVLFDLAMSDAQDRVKLTKDLNNNLVLSVYDTSGGLKKVVTNSAVSFSRETWKHVAFTMNAGQLTVYLDGTALAATTSGSGTGQLSTTAASFFLGSDYRSYLTQGAVFDDLVATLSVLTADAVSKIANDRAPYLGMAAARKGFNIGHGNATSHATPGTQTAVAHGLGVAPSFIQLTERANGVVYLSAPADSTNFYVTASASTINFDWRAHA